jgi:DNA-binding MarR family transcriptional regulator/GNAT superfamily N-acetyltransferase
MVVDALRQFNRSYTQRIGLLDDSYLDTGRPLGTSRLLFEIEREIEREGEIEVEREGKIEGAGSSVLDLRRRLGLDSGYISRMLRQLEREHLVAVTTGPTDRRQRIVQLTARGRTERAELERRSQDRAQQLVAPLTDRQRIELTSALDTVDRLLRIATVEFDRADPRSPDAGHALGEYFAELDARFPGGFDPGAARDEQAEAAALAPPGGAFVLIRSDLDTIGCGGVHGLDHTAPPDAPATRTAEIKRMWIHTRWRGLGLGRRLLEHLEQIALAGDYTRVVLDTNDTLSEAIAMYEAVGYESIDRYNDNPYAQRWFAKQLRA